MPKELVYWKGLGERVCIEWNEVKVVTRNDNSVIERLCDNGDSINSEQAVNNLLCVDCCNSAQRC